MLLLKNYYDYQKQKNDLVKLSHHKQFIFQVEVSLGALQVLPIVSTNTISAKYQILKIVVLCIQQFTLALNPLRIDISSSFRSELTYTDLMQLGD